MYKIAVFLLLFVVLSCKGGEKTKSERDLFFEGSHALAKVSVNSEKSSNECYMLYEREVVSFLWKSRSGEYLPLSLSDENVRIVIDDSEKPSIRFRWNNYSSFSESAYKNSIIYVLVILNNEEQVVIK